MTSLHVAQFFGKVPRTDARLLSDAQAQEAFNCRLTSGSLEALDDLTQITAPGIGEIKSFYRLVSNATGSEYWLAFITDVDITPGPVADSVDQRLYFTGEVYEPRITNLALASSATPYPKAWYVLGVTPPVTAPAVSVAGGGAPTEARAYVYTFVTAWGEESVPSPATTYTGNADGTWTIASMDVAPLNTFTVTGATWSAGVATYTVASTFGLRVGEYVTVAGMTPSGYDVASIALDAVTSTTISVAMAVDPGAFSAGGTIVRDAPHNTSSMFKRVYRAVSGVYTLVRDNVPVATTSTTDGGLEATTLPSLIWDMPPADMRGIIAMENGVMVGFSGREVCFSEPYRPHAWPIDYRQTVTYDVVGLGVFGQSVAVLTTGTPVVISGLHPESMSADPINSPWPCVAKRGIVSSTFGVQYPSTVGLVLIGPGGPTIITRPLYTEYEWKMLRPETFIAALHDHRYVTRYSPDDATNRILFFEPSEPAAITEANERIGAIYVDKENGELYVSDAGAIYQWDADPGLRLAYDWLSKEFLYIQPIMFTAIWVDADFRQTDAEIAAAAAAYAAALAVNQALVATGIVGGGMGEESMGILTLAGSNINDLPTTSFDTLNFSLIADGATVFTKSLTNNKPFRPSDGDLYRTVSFRISGNVKVNGVHMADSMKGLVG